MKTRFVYTRDDGRVEIMTPVIDDMKAVRATIPEDATNIIEVDEKDIPTDRTFRDAWKQGASGILLVDMPKAREIHMNRIRAARALTFKRLDLEYMRADEAGDGDEKIKVAIKKQVLRDLPKTFKLEIYGTPDALKAAWPPEL